jgi:hypothetical protein
VGLLVLIAAWLLVLGYGLAFTGLSNFWGSPIGLLEGLTSAS